MKKSFTYLISEIRNTNRFTVGIATLFLVILSAVYLRAAIGISVTGASSYTLSADLAATTTFTPVNNITVKESVADEFAKNGNYKIRLTAPVGWVFPSLGITATLSTGGEVTLNSTPNYITDATGVRTVEFSFTVSNGNQNKIDEIIISGLSVKSTNGQIDPTQPKQISVQVLNGSTIVASSSLISLSQVAGTPKKLAFISQPVGTETGAPIPNFQAVIQDQFGNRVTTATNTVTLAIGTNPSAGNLTGGTSTIANGVVTFTGYSIDKAGIGYTLVASGAGLTSVGSDPFTVNNKQPIIDNTVECLSEGDPETIITINGNNFVSGATVLINNVSRPATVINSTTLTTTVTTTELASAGNLSLKVKNPTPASNSGESNLKFITVERLFKNLNITGDREVCTGEKLPYWGGTMFTNYEWSVTEGASILPRSNESVYIKFNDQAPTSGLVTVTVSAKNRCGVSSTQSFDIKVNQTPPPTISYDTPLIFCEGGSVILKAPVAQVGESEYIYQWMLGEDVIYGASSSTFEAKAPGQYSVVVTAENTCAKRSSFVTVSTTTPLIQGEIQGNTTYCQNATPTVLTATVSGGTTAKTYLWEKADNESGPWEAANGINNEISYFPSTAIEGTKFYRRVVTSGGCTSISDPVAVTVTPEITNNTISTSDQTVCSGSVIASLDGVAASGNINVDYLWEQSITGEANAWTPAEGANDQEDYQPATKSVDKTTVIYYRRKVVSGNCTNYSNVVKVKVTSMPDALIKEGSNTYFCSPGTATLTTDAGDNYSYTWFKENGETDLAVGTNNNSIEVGEVGQYYVIVTQVTDGNSCVTISEPITVEETIVNNNIINSQNQTVCYGAVPAPLQGSNATSSLGNVTYQWQKSSDGVSFDNVSNASGVDLVLGEHTADTWYRRIARVGSCINYNKNPETGEEIIIKISVLPQLVNTLSSSDQTVCLGGAIQPITGNEVTGGNGSGSYTFIWYQRTGNGNWEVAPGTNSEESYTPQVADVAGTYSFRRDVVSGTCAPIASSNVVTVTVQPAITGNIIAGATAYCQGAIATALGTEGSVSGGNAGSYTYIWQQSNTGTNGSWVNVAGDFDNETYIPSTATAGTIYYRRLITSGQCTNNESNVLAVTVTSSIVNNINTTKTAYCQNDTAVPINGTVAGGNGENTYTFRWEKSETGSNPWIPIEGEEGSAFTPLTSAAGTAFYRRVVTSGNCANKTSEPIAITVNGTITNTISSTSSAYCQNATGAAAIGGVPTGGTGTYTYAWQVKTGESGTWTTVGGNTINLTPSTLQPGEFFYKRIVSSGACTGSESNEFKVTILPAIVNSLSNPAEYSYCQYTSSTALTGTISGGNGSYTYLWQQSTTGTSNWSAASGTNNQESYTPSTATAGTMFYRRTVTSGVCATAVASNVVKVVVIPAIANNMISGPATVCYGLQPNIINGSIPTNGNGSYTYLWEQSTNGGSTWGPADGTNNQQNYQPNALTITTQYRRTVSAGTCIPNVSSVHTIVVKPLPTKPTITNLATSYYTADASVTMQVSPTGLAGSFTVKNAAGQIVSTSSTFAPCTLGAGTFTVTYTATNNGCSNTSGPIVVTIKQSTYKVVVTANPFPICRGQNTLYTAKIYRDATVIYPYIANEHGQPIDGNGNVIADAAIPSVNMDYFTVKGIDPATIPSIIVANAWRFYEPIVQGGTLVNAYDITEATKSSSYKPTQAEYKWTKNNSRPNNGISGNSPLYSQSGLSSTDWYAVQVTSIGGTTACPNMGTLLSQRMYLSEPDGYSITINPVTAWCGDATGSSGTVDLTAVLGNLPGGWSTADLTYKWYLLRNGTSTPLSELITYTGGTSVSITLPKSTFQNGDKVYVDFNTNYDTYTGLNSKCLVESVSPQITIRIDQPATITANLSTTAQELCEGGTATFQVNATGTNLQYVWYKEGSSNPITTGGKYVIQNTTTGSKLTITGVSTSDIGSYYVLVSNGANVVCSVILPSAKAPLKVNPLPQLRTLNGSPFCPVTQPNGTDINLANSESGVTYTLTKVGDPSFTPVTRAGTGTATPLHFGNFKEGTYRVSGTSSSSCLTPNVGEVTVTAISYPVVTGELQIFWRDNTTNWEVVANSDHLAKGVTMNENFVYEWYIGEDTQEPAFTTTYPDNSIIIPNPKEGLYVRCIIRTPSGICLPDVIMDNIGITPLPVELTYFKAVRSGTAVVLTWETASEKDNKGFEVQVSQDGKSYRQLQFVPSKNGTSSLKQKYEFVDKENGKHGTRHYRLRQLDLDGKYTYYGPVAVAFGEAVNKVLVYPNPFEREVKLEVDAEKSTTMEVTLTNIMGRQLLVKHINVEQGKNTTTLDLGADLPAGVYIITTRYNGTTNSFKLFKQ